MRKVAARTKCLASVIADAFDGITTWLDRSGPRSPER
ncbi:hypothetical protein SAMN05216566_14417 [Aureimonas phyllosphaerae]|uniref:Uncharacterized protein n=1 Tax=Aureimonas phyllosphaerae TaxID=1166078 RepID=A0A7W6FWJ6_9HYPH|nr:hypothetical protein [Aureimonas phyllosphaerae]MBB3962258.1 hypothetical protein [Aureimonas phyllosphaerae]SFF59820.1 hypothetical protein SAMN05216566_14417 [Aureimonas phyllosphaerae]